MTKRSLALLIAIGAVFTVLIGSLQSKLFSDKVTLEESVPVPAPAVPYTSYAFYEKKIQEETMIRVTLDFKEIYINSKFYRYKGQDKHGWTVWERKK